VTGPDPVADELRRMLARITGDEAAASLGEHTPLLRDGLGLDSLRATVLLAEIRRTFGVDVAGADLNLDSLTTFGTLAAYVAAARRPARPAGSGDQPPAATG
jgi:acyl carrier protein